jgi:aspartate/methionine/tyrosine aminotransferase
VASLVPLDLPLRPDGSFLPDFAAAAAAAPAWPARPRALLLNYPQNPTAAVADDAFWDEALAFAEAHDLL